jgi:hypothetical protein
MARLTHSLVQATLGTWELPWFALSIESSIFCCYYHIIHQYRIFDVSPTVGVTWSLAASRDRRICMLRHPGLIRLREGMSAENCGEVDAKTFLPQYLPAAR